MKKILIIFIIIFTLTGCSYLDVKKMDTDQFIDFVVSDNHKMINQFSKGYNYYLPSTARVVKVIGNNEVLYSNNKYMYLYVDLISYKKQVQPTYENDEDLYYYKDLSNEDDTGYIKIEKLNNEYIVKVVYNYASIESYVYEEDIEDVLIDMTYIVTSIEYNDLVINSLINEEDYNFIVNEYEIFKPLDQGFYLEYGADSLIDTSRSIIDPDFIKLNLKE